MEEVSKTRKRPHLHQKKKDDSLKWWFYGETKLKRKVHFFLKSLSKLTVFSFFNRSLFVTIMKTSQETSGIQYIFIWFAIR